MVACCVVPLEPLGPFSCSISLYYLVFHLLGAQSVQHWRFEIKCVFEIMKRYFNRITWWHKVFILWHYANAWLLGLAKALMTWWWSKKLGAERELQIQALALKRCDIHAMQISYSHIMYPSSDLVPPSFIEMIRRKCSTWTRSQVWTQTANCLQLREGRAWVFNGTVVSLQYWII